MQATHRVKNSNGKTTGFIIDGKYETYKTVLKHINFVNNIVSDKKGVIKCKKGSLPEIERKELNKRIYKTLCKKHILKRDIEEKFETWKRDYKTSRTIMYLKGARQIGKTTELKKFAYKNFENVIYVNLSQKQERENFRAVCNSNSPRFGMLQYCDNLNLDEYEDTENTILIIDEIQIDEDIYNSLRKLQDGLKCRIAVSGSYLGVTIRNNYFLPAGTLHDINMLPLSFKEFCRAFKCEEMLMGINLYGKDDDSKYKELTDLYLVYKQIGGYPDIVIEYIDTKDVNRCLERLNDIINRFTDESLFYFTNDKQAIIFNSVYVNALAVIAKEKRGTGSKDIEEITNFVKSSTKEMVSRNEVNEAMSWLVYANIIGTCNLFNNGDSQDVLYNRRFYFMDCGITNCIANRTTFINSVIQEELPETFAYSELYRLYTEYNKDYKVKGDKPFCSVYNGLELDFVIIDKNDIKYGIEVKTKRDREPTSLLEFLKQDKIDEAYLAQITRGGIGEKIKKIPIYTIGCRFPYEDK